MCRNINHDFRQSIDSRKHYIRQTVERKKSRIFSIGQKKRKKKTEKKKVANSNIPSRKNSKFSITEGIKFRQQVKDKTGMTKFTRFCDLLRIFVFFRDHLMKFGEFSAIFDEIHVFFSLPQMKFGRFFEQDKFAKVIAIVCRNLRGQGYIFFDEIRVFFAFLSFFAMLS